MDSDALTPDSRRTLLSGLRQQLDNIDPTQQAVKDQIARLQVGGFEAAVEKLRFVSLKMIESRTALRQVFDSIARPMLRPLKFEDLPDELLVRVFSHLNNLDDIKRLRLSSWRLNKTSSQFLLETLHINLSPSSLLRLDRASRHRDISPGIRRIVVSADLYSSNLGKDFRNFALVSIKKLRKLSKLDSRKHELTMLACSRICKSWRAFLAVPEPLASDNQLKARLTKSDIDALYSGYLRYYQLYLEQQGVLFDGTFGQALAEATSRMPIFKELVIRDRSPISENKELRRCTQKKLEDLVKDPTLLVETMMIETRRWEMVGAEPGGVLHTNVLYLLPMTIQGGGGALGWPTSRLTSHLLRSFPLSSAQTKVFDLGYLLTT